MPIATVTPLMRLPRNIEQSYSYGLPEELIPRTHQGSIVIIQFRNRRVLGVVKHIGNKRGKKGIQLKNIISTLPYSPLNKDQIWLISEIEALYGVSQTLAHKTFIPNLQRKPVLIENIPAKIKNIPSLGIDRKRVKKLIDSAPGPTLLSGQIFNPGDTLFLSHIYKHLKNKGQVLCLFPEKYSLDYTRQIYKKYFNGIISIWHGTLNSSSLGQEWQRVSTGEARIVLGTRSALFAPFQKLNSIILFDVANDGHKSWDSAPHYDVRELAQKLTRRKKISYLKTGLLPTLTEAYKTSIIKWRHKPQTALDIVDRRSLSPHERHAVIIPNIIDALNKNPKKHCLILANRRGYSIFACRDCEFIPRCDSCDKPFTYTKTHSREQLLCFNCHIEREPISRCPICRGSNLKFIGAGIERALETLRQYFPDRSVERLDAISMRTPENLNQALKSIRHNDINITVATTIVLSKLWTLPKSAVVAVLNAEGLLASADWRANEQALLTLSTLWAVAEKHFIVDTRLTDHPVMHALKTGNYVQFLQEEQKNRKRFGYPPYGQIIKIVFTSNISEEKIAHFVENIIKKLKLRPSSKMTDLKGRTVFIIKTERKYNFKKLWSLIPPEATVDLNPLSLL